MGNSDEEPVWTRLRGEKYSVCVWGGGGVVCVGGVCRSQSELWLERSE